MKVKISEKGIYKIIPANEGLSSKQINDIIESCLTINENIFAKFSATTGYYVWELPGDGWEKLSKANDSIKADVYEIISKKRKIIESKLKDTSIKPIDALFRVPSEDYIFYRIDDDNSIEVMLSGWDYRFPAKGPEESGSIKVMPPVRKQDVKLIIKEAGNTLPNYKLSAKMLNGKYADKETDSSGSYPMKLPVGYKCCIMSKDKEHDFSFVVEKDKYEYVFDITKPLELKINVHKDGLPANNQLIKINYNGSDYTSLTNSEGTAIKSFDYIKDAVVDVAVDNQTQSVQVQYPTTEISFDIETPKAVIDITYKRNGSPVENEKIVLDITGKDSVILTTNINGKATYSTPYSNNVRASVKVNSIEQSKYLEKYTEFVIDENIEITPPTPPAEEEVPEVQEPKPYNIFVKTENGNYPQGSIILKQGGKEYNLQLDNEGKCCIGKDMIVPYKTVNATIDTKLGVFDDFKIEFDADEDDYEIMLKFRKRSLFWPLFLECLAAGAVVITLSVIYSLFNGIFF